MADRATIRLERAQLALRGVALGDAFGERLMTTGEAMERYLEDWNIPPGPWRYTDDTEMALAVVRELARAGTIEQDALAARFAAEAEFSRGYGPGATRLITRLRAGEDWRGASKEAFGGRGSFGNGAAMRVAPLGAYYADDIRLVVEEARKSAEITHAHPEGIAGAVAVAVAAAWAWRIAEGAAPTTATLIDLVLTAVPESDVAAGLRRARELSPGAPPTIAAQVLGNGTAVTAQDTVPYAIWCAASCLTDFRAAMWLTAVGRGDMDTTCAIVGGIVAMAVDEGGLPLDWPAEEARV